MSKPLTFYFSKANIEEARGVVRVLPLFIQDYIKLNPCFFCYLEALASALEEDNVNIQKGCY